MPQALCGPTLMGWLSEALETAYENKYYGFMGRESHHFLLYSLGHPRFHTKSLGTSDLKY